MPEPTKKTYTKSTREEVDARVDACFSLLLDGVRPKLIATYVADKWAVEERMSYYYIEKARDEIKTSKAVDRDFELGRELLRRDALYQKAIREEGVLAALAVCDSRCKLLGLFAPEQLQITDGENPYADLTCEEIDFALEAIDAVKRKAITRKLSTTQKRKDKGGKKHSA